MWDQRLAACAGWAVAGGHLPKSSVIDGVNIRIAHNHYVTCCFREGFTEGTGLHGSPAPPWCHHRDPVSGPPFLSTGGVVSGIAHGHCLLAARAVQYLHNQKAQSEAALGLDLTLSSCSSHVCSSLLASLELHGLGRAVSSGLWIQLSSAWGSKGENASWKTDKIIP